MELLRKRVFALLLWGAFCFTATGFSRGVNEAAATGAEAAESADGAASFACRLSAYTTYFNQNEGGRCANIAIAASLIDGVTVQPYGTFSFNATVGKRTEEAGFQSAKIILNGEYVQGVGGGVCQVSTTLYNAALKSGLAVTEWHAHSLAVGYVAPSRDAMVSTESDLKLQNVYAFPVRLVCTLGKNWVKIAFFGAKEGYRYELNAKVIERISPPVPIIRYGEKEETLRAPKEGVKSELYLECYQGAALLYKKRLRKDEYLPVQAILGKKVAATTN